jgi:hypothetical protein
VFKGAGAFVVLFCAWQPHVPADKLRQISPARQMARPDRSRTAQTDVRRLGIIDKDGNRQMIAQITKSEIG